MSTPGDGVASEEVFVRLRWAESVRGLAGRSLDTLASHGKDDVRRA